ncbi:phosphate acetyltransferase [Amorphus sp. 3PC139-8]|uniref:phosphate acetyltransferase n=1 Tax=Amorphus sp. 3PC139-8 TaxID=2735676 RepID=UPI00345D4EB0
MIEVGQRTEIRRRYDKHDAATFAELSGQEGLQIEAVPEPLIGALFSYLLGVKLPGFGTNYLKQEMTFLRPAPFDEDLTASVEVTRIRTDKDLVDLATVCRTASGDEICTGRALVLVKDVGA